MSAIGTRIKERRRDVKMTQLDIAQRIGVSKVAVSQWENETSQPNGENLLALANALGVTPQWLLTGRGDTPAMLPNVSPTPPSEQTLTLMVKVCDSDNL